jgi:hypothetical protein
VTEAPAITDTGGPIRMTLPTLSAPSVIRPGSLAAASLPENFAFGRSVQGRDLTARRIGDGGSVIVLVGGIHGGYEANTVRLVLALIDHFSTHPADVLPGVTLILIPALNPDGVELGRTVEGRFNANGVDLNRNWGCGWSAEAYFRDTQVDAGAAPFSEPETLALAALINDTRPAVVLFYHSAADGVFAGECATGGVSGPMSALYGDATGYSYGAAFSSYPVTGTAATWVDGQGIPAADVELASVDRIEFDRNLRGVMALQCWLTGATGGVCAG